MVNKGEIIMKKILFPVLALVALLFAGCSKNEIAPVQENTFSHTIKASISGFGTKTAMYGNAVNWEEGDEIALFANDGTKVKYTLSEGAGTTEGTFATNGEVNGKTFVAALYPYEAGAVYSNGKITTSTAKEFTWEEGKNNKALMAAQVNSPDNISFRNAGAILALTVNNIPAGYDRIVLSSGRAMNGATEVTFTDGIPESANVSEEEDNKEITIKFAKSTATACKVFHFPMGTAAEATSVTVSLSDGTNSLKLIDNYTMANAIRNSRYYRTINFDSNGKLPVQLGAADDINEKIGDGIYNFILNSSTSELEITAETTEELQIAVTSASNMFTIKGEAVKGKVILCTPAQTQNLNIDLPNATVEVKPDAGVAAYSTITANTSENTLIIPFGTSVNDIIVKGGNIRVTGTVNCFTYSKENGKVKIFKEEGALIPDDLDSEKFEVIDYASENFIKSKEDLIAAIAAASDGDVISLGKDIEDLTDILVIGKAITLDGQGHTIASSATRAINVSGVAGAVTIKNLNIIASGERAVNVIRNSKNVTIENVKAAASKYCVNVAASAPDATITINGSDLTGLSTVNVSAPNTIVNIKDSRIFCNDKNSAENYGAITISLDAPGSKVTVEGGVIVVNDDSKGGSTTGGTIEFSNTTKGNTDVLVNCFAIRYSDTHYSFETFEEALANHKNGETIIMAANYTLPSTVTIAADKEVVLDLNGCTLSQEKECTAHYEMIKNNGKLTIKDSQSNGKITFKDTGSGDPAFGWGSYTIGNYKTLVVENGTIENTTALNSSSAIHMYCSIHQGWGAESTTVNGGIIKNDTYRSIRINKGTLNINGGKYEGQIWMHPSDNNTSITITGGDFAPRGVDGSSVFIENGKYTVGMAVSGGTFNTKIGCSSPTKDGVKGKITGGKFTEKAKTGTNSALFATGTWSELVDNFYTFTAN